MINCRYLFYIKAGSCAGFGHMRRSLAIATELRNKRESACFLVDGDDCAMNLLKEKGFKAYHFSKVALKLFSPEVTIIDQKGDVRREASQLRSKGSKICLIDNATSTRLMADIVIYPVAHFDRSLGLQGFKGKKFIGAKYFPLNAEFRRAKKIRHATFTVLVTMGGSDPNKITLKVAKALEKIKGGLRVVFVLGAASKRQELPKDKRFKIVRNPGNMARLMSGCDLAITAFGTTLYELAYMGVPALIISNYKNEKDEVRTFERRGTSIYLGHFKRVSDRSISNTVNDLMDNKRKMSALSRNGKKLVDGKGAMRIVRILRGVG